jgi:hypothetical protein
MSEEHPVGVDAQDATNSLYNIIGDDNLFDRLQELADIDPTADARDVVTSWLYDNLPQVYQRIESEMGDLDTPAEPGKQEVDEAADSLEGKVTALLKRFEENAMEIGAYGDPDINEVINHLKNGNSEAAAEVVWYSYSDQDGGEVPQIEPYVDDLQAEFEELTRQGTTNEGERQNDDVESIQSAIIRRILNNLEQHSELLKKAGPDGIMNAAHDVASFHAPMEEIGTSDVSIMVREVYNEVGVEYPEEVNEDKEECKYCGGDCPNDEEHACDGYLGDIDDLYKVTEAKDTIKYDPKTGKLTGWEHEGDWEKQTKKKDPVGKIHHMSDVARRRTEKMAKDETLEEAFERALNEAAINVGDMIRDKTQPTIQGKVVGDIDENYIIQVEDDQYHIKKLNAEKVAKEAIEMPDNPDYSGYDKPTFQRKGIVPGQPNKTLPGMNDKKKPGWVGVDTTKPAYQRQADYEQEREQMKKLAGVK